MVWESDGLGRMAASGVGELVFIEGKNNKIKYFSSVPVLSFMKIMTPNTILVLCKKGFDFLFDVDWGLRRNTHALRPIL